MDNRQETHAHQRAFALTLIISLLSVIYCACQLLRIPADSKNAFLFGLSKERLLMLGGFFALFIMIIICLILRNRVYSQLSENKILKIIFPSAAIFNLFFLLMPDYRFRRMAAVFIRLRPFILCFFLISAAFTLFYIFTENRFSFVKTTISNLNGQKTGILITLFILLLFVVFVELSGLGKTAESSLWNKNGIPLQSIQLFTSFVVFLLFWNLNLFPHLEKNKRILNFFIIWAVSAIIWSLAPGMHHFFAPGPFDPNLTYYPYSDAAGYDIPAQTALNGWGFNFGRTLLKPSVVLISFISRLIAGNNTTTSMLVQSAFYAILPAIIYLFGSAIGGYGCGYLAAAFSLFKEWNALRTRSVSTVHSRLVMSEFLTQILLALFCYAVFRLLQKRGKEILYAILAGGAFTLGIFTRYNFFAFFPAALLIIFIGYRKEFRKFLMILLFFFVSSLITAVPFFYRERNISWNFFSEINYTVKYVLVRQRFKGDDPLTEKEIIEILKSLGMEVPNPDNTSITTNGTPSSTGNPSAEPAALQPVPDNTKQTVSSASGETENLSENTSDSNNTSQDPQDLSNNNDTVEFPFVKSMINHGLHNIISSFLTLPMEGKFEDLNHLYSQEGDGLWRDDWQGEFSFRQWIYIIIWILLGSTAIGVLIQQFGLAGFSIPYFWVVYAFSIGISRSSGGRYIVPVNWIPMLLLAFLCTLLLSRGKINVCEPVSRTLPIWQPVLALIGFASFFSLMVLFESIIPSKITKAPDGDLSVLKNRLMDHAEIDWDQVENQYESGSLHISHGVSLYPRYYYYRGGEHTSRGALMRKNYSRMTFFGINQDENGSVLTEYLMPHQDLIGDFPQDSIYRVISCSTEYGYEDVLAVTIDTPDGQTFTYIRDPLPEFSCPVPEPDGY